MKVLAIDTSNLVMGIAVTSGNVVVGEIITNLKKNHSVRVMPAIESLLADCDMKPSDLDKIVVAKGPGSYTGVRIGVTIAKTLAWALNIPLVGVSSLEVLASNGRFFDGVISPLFDARRGQVYTGLYTFENKKITILEKDQIILVEEWIETIKKYDQNVLFLGNDLPIHQPLLANKLGNKAIFGKEVLHNPRPSELAFLGMAKQPEDTHQFVPNYIRLAEAEANWLAKQKQV